MVCPSAAPRSREIERRMMNSALLADPSLPANLLIKARYCSMDGGGANQLRVENETI
jgi:hypothetical protein